MTDGKVQIAVELDTTECDQQLKRLEVKLDQILDKADRVKSVSIDNCSTKDLSEQLSQREGVEAIRIEPEDAIYMEIHTAKNGKKQMKEVIMQEGPMVILINQD